MKSNDQPYQFPLRHKRFVIFNPKSYEVSGVIWDTILMFGCQYLDRDAIQERADALVWPAVPAYWELEVLPEYPGLYELRARRGEVPPENEQMYRESLEQEKANRERLEQRSSEKE